MTVFAALVACRDPDPRPGTFVGNPELTARVRQTPVVRVVDGALDALEVLLGDCDGVGDVPLGPELLRFDGPVSEEILQIPAGTHCGVFFAVDDFTLRLDEGADEPTVLVADDFDLWVPTRFAARRDERYTVTFGSDEWLEQVAALAGPGENDVHGDPELEAAFFGGLEGSDVGDEAAAGATDGVPTRVDPDHWPTSPSGVPSSGVPCVDGDTLPLAVPIPPAAMLAAGYSLEVGWCEASVTFVGDLQAGYQTDWADGTLYEIVYDGWSQGCGALHCGTLVDHLGRPRDLPCTALAVCDAGTATVTGFQW